MKDGKKCLPSLGQHRHREHPRWVNEERLSEMLVEAIAVKRSTTPLLTKVIPQRSLLKITTRNTVTIKRTEENTRL